MLSALFLSELTLPILLWRALRGETTCVVEVMPHFPPLAPLLRRLHGFLASKGLTRSPSDCFPALARFVETNQHTYHTDIYTKTETWMRKVFKYSQAEGCHGFALAMHHNADLHIDRYYKPLYFLRALVESKTDHVVYGVSKEMLGLYADFYKVDFEGRARSSFDIRAFWALVSAVAIFLASFAIIVRRLRLKLPPPRHFFIGTDFNPGRDFYLCADLAPGPDDILVVLRNRGGYYEQAWRDDPVASRSTARFADDGLFDLRSGMLAFARCARDALRLGAASWGLPPALYFDNIKLVVKSAQFRALFEQYRVTYFWAWDDYNTDHIIRTAELRRTGAISLGMVHAAPVSCTHNPIWRHIDFDRYYVQGRIQAKIYGDSWPANMAIRDVGTAGISAEQFRRLRRPPEGERRAVAIYLNLFVPWDRSVEVVEAVAGRFPNLDVILRLKPSTKVRKPGPCANLLARARVFPNVSEWDDDPYDLLGRATYVLSDPSTMVIEAMQVGRQTFLLDLVDDQVSMYFRSYPGLALATPAAVVQRLEAAEAGEPYPWPEYADLVNLSGQTIYEIIREDLGLPSDDRVAAGSTQISP